MFKVSGPNKQFKEGELPSVANLPFTLLIASVKLPPETFIWRLVQEAVALGIRVQVIVSVQPGQKIPRIKDVQLIKLPSWNASWLHRLSEFLPLLVLKAFRYPKALYRLISLLMISSKKRTSWREKVISLFRFLPFVGLKPDVLHFQWNATAIECLSLFDYFKCPVVISCRGSQINVAPHNPRRAQIREDLRKTFARAAAIHCVAEAIVQQAICYGLDRSKSWIIRPAVDPNFYEVKESASGDKEGPIRILTTGSLLWVKGHEYALLAVRRLRDLGVLVEFEIIGSGPDHQRLMYTVHDLGLQDQVRLRGQLPPEEVRNHLLRADVFLLSSLSEGISNAALEAMACGLPVVTTNCGGMREAVRDGVDGFVVPVRDVDAMADALRRVAEDHKLRARLGEAARQRVLEQFSLKQQGRQFLHLYMSLMQGKDALGQSSVND